MRNRITVRVSSGWAKGVIPDVEAGMGHADLPP